LRLLLDEQQDRHVAEVLRHEGHDVIAVTEDEQLRGAADRALLEGAASTRRAVVTANVGDFVMLHREFVGADRRHCGIVLAPRGRFTGKSARRALLAALRSLLRAHPAEDALRDQLIWLE
jgi:hypothetical protein